MSQPVRTRIAPSPTGMPHIGTIFQALVNYALAKQALGQFIVRIEDTDQARIVEGAQDAIFQALDWFHLTPDESPVHGGDLGPYRQSQRLSLYKKYAFQLVDSGHAYYCFCSSERLDHVRKQMQKDGQPPMYDRHCRDLDQDQVQQKLDNQDPHVIRLKVEDTGEPVVVHDLLRGDITFDSAVIDDQVLLKSDGFPTYHLAVVVDDHLMEITHIVRGEEWISSAPKHVLIAKYLDWPVLPIIHTPLLRNPDRSKLSKRHGHASVSWYKEQGYLPEATLNFLATRVWNHPQGKEIFSLEEFVSLFDYKKLHIQAPVVDLQKLDWYNGIYIREHLSEDQLLDHLKPFLPSDWPLDHLKPIIPLIKDRLVKLSDIKDLVDFFFQDIEPDHNLLLKKADQELVTDQLTATTTKLKQLPDWDLANIESAIRGLQEQHDWHKSQFFMLLRLASTGKTATPPLFETIQVLGKDKTLTRLNKVQQIVSG